MIACRILSQSWQIYYLDPFVHQAKAKVRSQQPSPGTVNADSSINLSIWCRVNVAFNSYPNLKDSIKVYGT